MSCVLRATGKQFDVDSFLVGCPVEPLSIWRKGQRRSQAAEPSETSGVRFEVSSAEFSDLPAQINDARAFFQRQREWVAALAAFPGVESIVADFGVETRAPHWSSFCFGPELLAALSNAGVALELSIYPVVEARAGDA